MEDLLYVLIGIEGNYVQFAPDFKPDDLGHRLNGARYVIDAALNPSIRELVERILPLASYYTSICAFVDCESGLEYGTVMHALCAAVRARCVRRARDRNGGALTELARFHALSLIHI